MQSVLFCVVLSVIFVATSGFQQQSARLSIRSLVRMSDPAQSNEFSDFIANPPTIKLESDEVVVDLEALAVEAAKEAFIPKSDLSGIYTNVCISSFVNIFLSF